MADSLKVFISSSMASESPRRMREVLHFSKQGEFPTRLWTYTMIEDVARPEHFDAIMDKMVGACDIIALFMFNDDRDSIPRTASSPGAVARTRLPYRQAVFLEYLLSRKHSKPILAFYEHGFDQQKHSRKWLDEIRKFAGTYTRSFAEPHEAVMRLEQALVTLLLEQAQASLKQYQPPEVVMDDGLHGQMTRRLLPRTGVESVTDLHMTDPAIKSEP